MLRIMKRCTPKSLSEQVIRIQKTEEWQRLNENDVNVIRSYFDSLDKKLIRDNLVDEQHGLCAYCMKRIRKEDTIVIEHFKSIKNKEFALDYQNMYGCCDGGRNIIKSDKKILCCDASKKDRELTINLQDENFISSIKYTHDGFIASSDYRADMEINNVLCLNGLRDEKGNLKYDTATQIVAGRRAAYRSFANQMEKLNKKLGNKERMYAEIKKMINNIENSDEFPEFAGVTLYFLRRRLRNIS